MKFGQNGCLIEISDKLENCDLNFIGKFVLQALSFIAFVAIILDCLTHSQ